MTTYRVKRGDSPASIASAHRVSVGSLFASNPHKPTRVVNGRQTWHSLGLGEELRVGTGFVGDPAIVSAAVAALVAAGGPCKQQNAGFVCALQTALGLKADGKYGSDTATAARRIAPNAPGACNTSAPPLWWGSKSDNKCVGAQIPSIPIALPSPVPGLPSIPGIPVSIPPPVPSAPSVAAAVAALSAIDPCVSSNAPMVCAAQMALGLKPDGKYGSDTANAVRSALGSAPPPCNTVAPPLWWGGKNDNKCGGAGPVPSLPSPMPSPMPLPTPSPVVYPPVTPPVVIAPPPVAPLPVVVAPSPSPSPSPSAPAPIVTAPVATPASGEKLSKGALVAAGVGVVALVGLAAMAIGGKGGSRGARGPAGRRSAPRRKKSSKSRRK